MHLSQNRLCPKLAPNPREKQHRKDFMVREATYQLDPRHKRVTFAHVCRHSGDEKHGIQELAAPLEWLGYQRLLLHNP